MTPTTEDHSWPHPFLTNQLTPDGRDTASFMLALPYHYSQTRLSGQHWGLIMSIHLGRVCTYPCFILYDVSKWEQTNDIRLSGLIHLSGIHLRRFYCTPLHPFNSLFSRITLVSQYQKGRTSLDLKLGKRWWGFGVAVTSAGPHANNLHLAPDRLPYQHLVTQFFTGWMFFLTCNQQCQSTEGNTSVINNNIYTHTQLFDGHWSGTPG